MPTLEELVDKFQNYSDEELFAVYNQMDGYTSTAKQAFEIVLDKRGGIDVLKETIKKHNDVESESSLIKTKALKLLESGLTPLEVIDRHEIQYLSKKQLTEIIDEAYAELEVDKLDRKIKPRTLIGGIFGGLIGGIIGGVLWGIQMVVSKHIMYIFGIGLVLLSYGSVRLFTGQSKKNVVVVILTVISVVFALLLGQIIFEIFG